MKILIIVLMHLAALPLLAAQEAAAQTGGAKAPPVDCAATMGPLPPRVDVTAFAIDGDTLAGVGLRPHLRIWGIQAPELRDRDKQETAAGMRARAAVEELLGAARHKVRCEVTKWDRYCRLVAVCRAGETDIGHRLLERGLAYGFYLDDAIGGDPAPSLAYAEAEELARHDRRGLWKQWLGEK